MSSAGTSSTGWQEWTPGRYRLAEGARWVDGRLVFVDLLDGDLYSCPGDRPGEARREASLGLPLGAVAPVRGRPGEWIAAAGTGMALLAGGTGDSPPGPLPAPTRRRATEPGGVWSAAIRAGRGTVEQGAVPPSGGRDPVARGADPGGATEPARGRVRWLARPEGGAATAMRMNDAVCDPAGRFWATSMDTGAARAAGSLWRLDPDGAVVRVLTGLTVPNGPAFSPDGRTLYLADSARGLVAAYPVEPDSGALGPGRRFAAVTGADGRPDGMAVDDDGCLWVALWGGGRVRRYAPDGRVLDEPAVPTAHPSSVAFGGGLMFVTTARHRLERPDALAGAVLARPSGVSARPAAAWADGRDRGKESGTTPW
ncbi:SMP-30/gluconolactonase/LRE family protein [Kitasatospora sp. NPDC048365]|uniref:SMP-30/gluconolactonase/LRE family protein n=1 Tax=Kitasatospora sp. NPDC048365 TaxID=3364050 RepID=UPI003710ED09